MKVALITCSKAKRGYPCTAAEMYSPSTLFSLSYKYSQMVADKVFILSAKYGLLEETDPINPYNLNLKDLPYKRRLDWANYVISNLRLKCDLENDEFIILAGKNYYENLLTELKHYTLPLCNQSMGQRLAILQKWLQEFENHEPYKPVTCENKALNKCYELHEIFNSAKRYSPNEINNVPFTNGIYIVFEKGEHFGEFDRIVRVGTHTSPNRLRNRLNDHFFKENKDGSIFRKNIGKAILNRDERPYLAIWSLDTSKDENKIYINTLVQQDIERKVSTYLRENMSFTVFPVDNNEQRLRLEEAIISTLNQSEDFSPSKQWLGNHSPEKEIVLSGMWLKKGLDADPLTDKEFLLLKECCAKANTDTVTVITTIQALITTNSAVKTSLHTSPDNSISSKIRSYIQFKFDQARSSGENECVLVSGEIHRALNLKNSMPTVCILMAKLKRPGDEVLHTTPSGMSSTIQIRYYLN